MMDFMLQAWVTSTIQRKKISWMLGKGERWTPGKKLKLLFAGYNGARNMGSDARVEEMIRQLRHVLGAENVEFSVMSQNFQLTDGYFKCTRQVHLPDIFPPFLAHEVPQHHGVVACEGSMFKSKFANALTTMMIGSLGIAAAENKLSVGYGGEAGHMDPPIQRMCARYCRDSLIITRNEESRALLRDLGVPTELGTDTAWTFPPLPPEYGRKALHDVGWDGSTPVLVVCPINPFEWPVKASVAKAVDAFRQRHRVFVVLAATERLDARPAKKISERLGGAPVLTSEQYNMYELVSILRACNMMASSRYHGIVTSMPALVPSCGITMDELIRNLMHERGNEDLLMNVDDPDLEPKLLTALEKLAREGDRIADAIGRTVVKNLKVMARMGVYFEEEVQRRYPEFPTRKGQWSWEDYLPPMDAGLHRLIGMNS